MLQFFNVFFVYEYNNNKLFFLSYKKSYIFKKNYVLFICKCKFVSNYNLYNKFIIFYISIIICIMINKCLLLIYIKSIGYVGFIYFKYLCGEYKLIYIVCRSRQT